MKRLLPFLFTLPLLAQQPETRLNPTVKEIVDSISEERVAATLKKLESFGTRYILSSQDDPAHGIGAAKKWIHDQFQGYSPRLQVSYQDFNIKKGGRRGQVIRDVDLSNIVAVLPGTTEKDHYVLITGHYDSLNQVRKPYTGEEQTIAESVRQGVEESEARRYWKTLPLERERGPLDFEATAAEPIAPGVTDDGSGTAAVMELARVMSAYQFDKTIVFVAFAAEEVGLSGSQVYAAQAKQDHMQIEAVLNNDIIGSDVSGNGRSITNVLRVFSSSPDDSAPRELARYTKLIAERYVPSMQVQMVFRGDRFLRGGDHRPFVEAGFPAVRLTSASENFDNQHTTTDTFANTSVPYATRAARMNAAVLASLALAPAPPVLNWTWASGPNKGGHEPMLTRGKSGYDAVLRWLPNTEPDLAGYAVLLRSTTSPVWEREIWVGNVTTYTMPDLSIDDIVIGVKAVDTMGTRAWFRATLNPFCRERLRPLRRSSGRRGAKAVKGRSKHLGDLRRLAPLDFAPMNHVHRLAVLEQRHGRRRRWIVRQNVSQMRDRRFITARENSSGLCRSSRMLERHSDGWSRTARSASTHRIDDHQDRTTARRKQPVHVCWSASLLHTVTGQIGAHGSDENFRIGHELILAGVSSYAPGRFIRNVVVDSKNDRRICRGSSEIVASSSARVINCSQRSRAVCPMAKGAWRMRSRGCPRCST